MKNYELAELDYMQGMKYQDIADKYGVKLSTVKSWKTRYKWDRSKSKKSSQSMRVKKKKMPAKSMQIIKENKDDGLNERQREFCLYYVKNFNATQAYLKAYGCSYYAASVGGCELLTKPKIKSEIDRLKQLKRNSIMLSEDDIVERYMRIAFSDMTDFAEFGITEYPAMDELGALILDVDGNVIMNRKNFLEFKASNQIDGGLISEISIGKNGMKVKLEDRIKALDWLSNYFGINPKDKHKIAYDNAVLALREKEMTLKDW